MREGLLEPTAHRRQGGFRYSEESQHALGVPASCCEHLMNCGLRATGESVRFTVMCDAILFKQIFINSVSENGSGTGMEVKGSIISKLKIFEQH